MKTRTSLTGNTDALDLETGDTGVLVVAYAVDSITTKRNGTRNVSVVAEDILTLPDDIGADIVTQLRARRRAAEEAAIGSPVIAGLEAFLDTGGATGRTDASGVVITDLDEAEYDEYGAPADTADPTLVDLSTIPIDAAELERRLTAWAELTARVDDLNATLATAPDADTANEARLELDRLAAELNGLDTGDEIRDGEIFTGDGYYKADAIELPWTPEGIVSASPTNSSVADAVAALPTIGEPWAGYADSTADQIIDYLRTYAANESAFPAAGSGIVAARDLAATVAKWEAANKGRKGILKAAQNIAGTPAPPAPDLPTPDEIPTPTAAEFPDDDVELDAGFADYTEGL